MIKKALVRLKLYFFSGGGGGGGLTAVGYHTGQYRVQCQSFKYICERY